MRAAAQKAARRAVHAAVVEPVARAARGAVCEAEPADYLVVVVGRVEVFEERFGVAPEDALYLRGVGYLFVALPPRIGQLRERARRGLFDRLREEGDAGGASAEEERESA